jgi:hypothetical protein
MSLIVVKMTPQRQLRIRKDCIRDIVPIVGYTNCYGLVRDNSQNDRGDFEYEEPLTYRSGFSLKTVYKYVDMEGFIKLLKTGILFKEPSLWNDPYEKLFYNAKYNNIDINSTPHPIYACCFTTGEETEASWKQYLGNTGLSSRCVRIKIKYNGLLSQLEKYAKEQNCKVYVGAVTYRVTEQDMELLLENGTKLNSFWMTKFLLKNYLSLLLLKRPAFYNEKEIRIMVVPERGSAKCNNNKIFIGCSDDFSEIMLSPDSTDEELEFIECLCRHNRITCPVYKSSLNNKHPVVEIKPIEKENSFIGDIYDKL